MKLKPVKRGVVKSTPPVAEEAPVQTAIVGVAQEQKMTKTTEDLYHCCRWCKWCSKNSSNFYDPFDGFRCTNPIFTGVASHTGFVYSVAEDGTLSDAIQEALHDNPKAEKEFEGTLTAQLRAWGVSEKRVKEFENLFREARDQYLDMELKGEIDGCVSKVYQNAADEADNEVFEGPEITDPFTFYCKEFW